MLCVDEKPSIQALERAQGYILQDHIDAYVIAYNDRAEPFVWTKKKVRQRRFKGRRITQL